jgi:hypothetical protein
MSLFARMGRRSFAATPRRFAGALVLAACVSLACAGYAAAKSTAPKSGAHFSGVVTQTAVAGFQPRLTFTVSKTGTSLASFHVGVLGCAPYSGTYTKGVYPFKTFTALSKIAVKSGRFTASGGQVLGGVALLVTVKGSFTSPTVASGTVSVTQHVTSGTTGPDGTTGATGPTGPGTYCFTRPNLFTVKAS